MSAALQTYEADSCCSRALAAAIGSGALNEATVWTHDKCGQEWRPVMVDGIKHWTPHCLIEVWR